ncbi:unnamed protein product, partial [Meganyctiphanes norvegica]
VTYFEEQESVSTQNFYSLSRTQGTSPKGYEIIQETNEIGKPYFCKYCPYKSPIKASLIQHTRKHTGEKPFACSYCSYESSVKGNLTKHVRIHTGEEPFQCDQCSYKTKNQSNLKTHQINHHGNI